MYHAITEACIADVVDTFYTKIRQDRLLGPIFEDAIGTEWDAHLETMNAFWSSVMLASGNYKGNPMMTHLQLPRLTQPYFERWLELWRETTAALCSEQVASLFVQRAEMIADRFLHAISTYHDDVGPEPLQVHEAR